MKQNGGRTVFGNEVFYGRAYIPTQAELDWTKSFRNSHSEGNYEWIFTKKEKESGYVDPK